MCEVSASRRETGEKLVFAAALRELARMQQSDASLVNHERQETLNAMYESASAIFAPILEVVNRHFLGGRGVIRRNNGFMTLSWDYREIGDGGHRAYELQEISLELNLRNEVRVYGGRQVYAEGNTIVVEHFYNTRTWRKHIMDIILTLLKEKRTRAVVEDGDLAE